MKKMAVNLLGLLFFSAMLPVSRAADGEINFTGSVTNNTFPVTVTDLNTSDTSGEIILGDVAAISLAKAGDIGGGGAFELSIGASSSEDDMSGKMVTVTFMPLSGTAGTSGQWLGINDADDAAKNVAIQIKDTTDKELQVGLASKQYSLIHPLRFTANYVATGPVTAGKIKARAAFSITYK